jgi:hypothetical protein
MLLIEFEIHTLRSIIEPITDSFSSPFHEITGACVCGVVQRLSHIAPLYARTFGRDICPYILCAIRQIVAERQSEDMR